MLASADLLFLPSSTSVLFVRCRSSAGGTTHKPNVLDAEGFYIPESAGYAKYLLQQGIPEQDVLEESFSRDTIGNAFFMRLVHTDVRGWRRLAVVNNEFHMARTQVIFDYVCSVEPQPAGGRYELSYFAVTNNLDADALHARAEKEQRAIEKFRAQIAQAPLSDRTMQGLHLFMFSEHLAYASRRTLLPKHIVIEEKDKATMLNSY